LTALSHLSERPALRSLLLPTDIVTVDCVGFRVGAGGASLGALFDNQQAAMLVQVSAVTVFAGAPSLCAYFGGLRPSDSWLDDDGNQAG
jgi:hypothetical protein